jgi:hypothetical protein
MAAKVFTSAALIAPHFLRSGELFAKEFDDRG